MPLTLTNVVLVLLTLLSAVASVLAGRWLRAVLGGAGAPAPVSGTEPQTPVRPAAVGTTALVVVIAAGALGLLAYRWRVLGGGDLLHAHVDGLLLIASLLAGVIVYLRSRPRLAGVGTFALPLLTLLLLWAVCASAWTYRPFKLATLHPVWRGVHLGCVYLGTLSAALAAGAGAAYLVFARRMKRHADPRGAGRVASLEAVEAVIVRSATLGFALLSAGLVSGWVIRRRIRRWAFLGLAQGAAVGRRVGDVCGGDERALCHGVSWQARGVAGDRGLRVAAGGVRDCDGGLGGARGA